MNGTSTPGPKPQSQRQAEYKVRKTIRDAEEAVAEALRQEELEAARQVEIEALREASERAALEVEEARLTLLTYERLLARLLDRQQLQPAERAVHKTHMGASMQRACRDLIVRGVDIREATDRVCDVVDRLADEMRAYHVAHRAALATASNGDVKPTPLDTPVTPAIRIGVTPERIADPRRHADDGIDRIASFASPLRTSTKRMDGSAPIVAQNADEDGDKDGDGAPRWWLEMVENQTREEDDPDIDAWAKEHFGLDDQGYVV